MNLTDAKTECQRWLDHLERAKESAVAMGKIATDRRLGRCTEEEGKRRLAEIDSRKSFTVYDAAKLADAVKFLLTHVNG